MTNTLRTRLVPADARLPLTEHVASVAWGARGVGKPKGIRREPKAYEDDAGEARSERSGPQSLTRAPQATDVAGV